MRMIQASQEKMETLKDNNRRMMKTTSQLASSIATTSQTQPVHLNKSALDRVTNLVTNTEGNRGNGESATDTVIAANLNPTNFITVVTLATTSIAVIPPTFT